MSSAPVVNNFQPSLTEWFKLLGKNKEAELIRVEDNERTDRFRILQKLLGVPCHLPEIFEASELVVMSPRFLAFFESHRSMPSAIRLIPKREGLPKLRDRGRTLQDCYEQWFLKQVFNPEDYEAEVYRHVPEQRWATIFIVNEHGVRGEVIRGIHNQLTNGETKNNLIEFEYDFKKWYWSEEDSEACDFIARLVAVLTVADIAKQNELAILLGATFVQNVIVGYFEAYQEENGPDTLIDYNRLLANYQASITHDTSSKAYLKGVAAFRGQATGPVVVVVVVDAGTVAVIDFAIGDILVTDNTDVRFLPLMQKAAAIVTNRGGILSHAAIVARELRKPCIIGTREATKLLKTGDVVLVDADRGMIQKV